MCTSETFESNSSTWHRGDIVDENDHTYLSDIYGPLTECEGGVELKEFTKQLF